MPQRGGESAHRQVPGLAVLQRIVRFGAAPDATADQIAKSVEALATRLPILTPEQDEALLREAGFTGVGTYYAALTLRGWLACA